MASKEQDYDDHGFFAKGICLPAFSAIIGCQLNVPAYSLHQCMDKQFALSTRSFDKFQEKEAFSGILPEGISQNIILRVFLKL